MDCQREDQDCPHGIPEDLCQVCWSGIFDDDDHVEVPRNVMEEIPDLDGGLQMVVYVPPQPDFAVEAVTRVAEAERPQVVLDLAPPVAPLDQEREAVEEPTREEMAVVAGADFPLFFPGGEIEEPTHMLDCGCVRVSTSDRVRSATWDILTGSWHRVPYSWKTLRECPACEITRLAGEHRINRQLLAAVVWTDLGTPMTMDTFRSGKHMFAAQARKILGADVDELTLVDQFMRIKKALAQSTWSEKSIWFEIEDSLADRYNSRAWLDQLYTHDQLPGTGWFTGQSLRVR